MNNEPLLKINNLSHRYKEGGRGFSSKYYTPLKDITFSIYPGETLGIIGGNGQGKSTLLRVLAGILQPHKGKIITNGNVNITLLSLLLGFDPQLTGRDNLYFLALLQGFSKLDVEGNIDKIIDFSGVGVFIDKPMKHYSSGMRSRLGFAMSLYLKTDLLLIDETLSVGDVNFKKKAMAEMSKKVMNSKQTVVIVSHSEAQMKKLCNRVIWLDEGYIKMEGDVNDVFEEYNNKYG